MRLADAGFLRQLGGDLVVARRELDDRGVRRAGLQQLDLDRADAAARLEHALAFDPLSRTTSTIQRAAAPSPCVR